jgi:hypothetical protein
MNPAPLDAAGGIVVLIIGSFLVVLCLLWLFLPFVIIGKFNELIKLQKTQVGELEEIARHTRPAPTAGKPAHPRSVSADFKI